MIGLALLVVCAIAGADAFQLAVSPSDACVGHGNATCWDIRNLFSYPVTFTGPGKRMLLVVFTAHALTLCCSRDIDGQQTGMNPL